MSVDPLHRENRPSGELRTQVPTIETQDTNKAVDTDTGSVDGNASLNDDLTTMSEYSNGLHVHRAGSIVSRRTSTETESVFLSLGFFQSVYGGTDGLLNGRIQEFSPLGPNSIFELTYASDQARQRLNKAPRLSVTINGGQTVVGNLRVPTTKDIPPIQLLKLKQRVSTTSLESLYDSSMLDAYKSFELSYNNLTEVSLQKLSAQGNEKRPKATELASTASTTSNFDTYVLDSNEDREQKLGMGIPDIYFDEDFRLDNSRVFKKVIENTRILPDENSTNPDEHLVNNTHLQEKISQYLDIVEVELISEISKSSDSFFGTFESIEGMRIKSETCKSKFDSIMTKMNTIRVEQAERGMKIVENLQKKKEIERLESALLQIKYIQSYFHLAQRSFGERKYSDCLKQVVMVEHLLQGIEKAECQDIDILDLYPKLPYPMQNLLNLPAFIHLRNDLEMLKKECSISYINDFITLLVEDLRTHCSSVSAQDTINRIYISINKSKKIDHGPINSTYQSISNSTKELLAGYIKNLIKSGYLVPAYDSYQDRIVAEIKGIIKTYLPNRMETEGSQTSSRQSPAFEQSHNPPSSNSSGSLSSNIKALTPREFESMLRQTYAQLSECLRRLTSQQKVLLDLSLSNIPVSSKIDFMSLDISNAIGKAIEISQIRLTKIINVRLEQNADLPLQMYLKLYALTSAFLQECEQISPMTVANSQGSLGEWFKNHVVYFVHKHHLNSMKQLISNTDKETWREITNPEQIADAQEKIQEIIDYSLFIEGDGKNGFNGSAWLKGLDLYSDGSNETKDQTVTEYEATKLHIIDEVFVVPRLILQNINLIRDYIMISKIFPQYASQIVTQMLNFFKLLNSKVSQAILNAGATRTAGLKHITTKHIAICIQTIEFNILIIPLVETIFQNVPITPPPNLNVEPLSFSLVLSNYKDHESELFSKLVSIMHDRIVSHCNAIVSIDWTEPLKPAVQSKTNKYAQQCHPYMETLVNETNTVTRVLMKYLSEVKYTLVLLQIFDDYRRMLVECYCTKLPQFKDFDEKQAVLKDIDYFRVNLCEMPGYGNSGQIIWENVNAMSTIEDEEMESKMRANFENEAKAIVVEEKVEEVQTNREPVSVPEMSISENGVNGNEEITQFIPDAQKADEHPLDTHSDKAVDVELSSETLDTTTSTVPQSAGSEENAELTPDATVEKVSVINDDEAIHSNDDVALDTKKDTISNEDLVSLTINQEDQLEEITESEMDAQLDEIAEATEGVVGKNPADDISTGFPDETSSEVTMEDAARMSVQPDATDENLEESLLDETSEKSVGDHLTDEAHKIEEGPELATVQENKEVDTILDAETEVADEAPINHVASTEEADDNAKKELDCQEKGDTTNEKKFETESEE